VSSSRQIAIAGKVMPLKVEVLTIV